MTVIKTVSKRSAGFRNTAVALAIATALTGLTAAPAWAADGKTAGELATPLNQRPAPDYDFNRARALPNARTATAAQVQALDDLAAATGASAMTARWNDFGGSPDVVYDFASAPYAGTPEDAARTFIGQHAALFGVQDAGDLRVFSSVAALGGHLVRFQQTYHGVPVDEGGIGVVMNAQNQVIMVSGPFFRDVAVDTTPTLSAEQAVAAAAANLAGFHVALPADVANLQELGLQVLDQQVQPEVTKIQPTLWVYPTADGYRLAWKVAQYSTNPFGLFEIAVDAHSGQILGRRDHVAYQSAPATLPGQETADIFPTFPQIDDSLKEQRVISTCATDGRQHPCGQERVLLRSFDATNRTTGVNGTLTGPNAIVNNALASKLPFEQAGLGTWHFSKDDPIALEARTDETDQYAEPAEHQDEINAFFFVNYNKEYVDHLHIGGDNNAFGGGAFPDQYEGKGVPVLASVHIPNILLALDAAGGTLPDPQDPAFVDKALSLDNALAVQVSGLFESVTGVKEPVPTNPTVYGHGYMFNDLALDGMVAYHETMHSTSTPIAGFEGTEGGHLNEGQADMWAYTMADYTSIGDYVVNAKGFRDYAAGKGIDPDSLGWIRSARSTAKYGKFLNTDDTHWGGEIYAAAMWDVREMLNRAYPQDTTYKRPTFKDGKPQAPITVGTNIFERDFLGAIYILGTTSPDTLVKARDALVVADQMLYPSDATDPAAPGANRALIEQVFAAHELGINARPASSGNVTISTQVSRFAGLQDALDAPKKVKVAPASANSLNVSWQAVPGAVAYEVLKRKTALKNQREQTGAFNDGDASTTGFRHVAYVAGNRSAYEDKGRLEKFFLPAGLDSLTDSEYVVRTVAANASGQLSWSRFSGGGHRWDGWSNPPVPVVYSLFVQTNSGALVVGDPTATGGTSATWGDPAFKGVTWDDVLVTTQPDASGLQAQLSSSTAPDLDFELRTTDGQVLASSAGATASEFVSGAVQPSTTYVLRVLGFAHGPAEYTVVSKQLLPQGSANANTTETISE